ncbi:MAG: DedA family protein [Gammaproteobacteria bacterium]|nr:DedA family protein [Gammaproteobacteria bacterium]MDE2346713.1 DedA family protein [Gammaproteobacteria bacterium]
MLSRLIALLSGFVVAAISTFGYGGIVLLMAIESACIPLPSEIIMPFAGYLVYKGDFNLWLVATAGAAGCVLGSLLAYWVGAKGGRPLAEKYGRYILVSPHDLETADRWFARRGDIIILVGRLLPLVRTFIAFPAGVARMPMLKFMVYTFIGSFLWCWGLAWIGMRLGARWNSLGPWFHRFDSLIALLVLLAFAWYLWRHLRHLRRPPASG